MHRAGADVTMTDTPKSAETSSFSGGLTIKERQEKARNFSLGSMFGKSNNTGEREVGAETAHFQFETVNDGEAWDAESERSNIEGILDLHKEIVRVRSAKKAKHGKRDMSKIDNIVLQVDLDVKWTLKEEATAHRLTLKDWICAQLNRYRADHGMPPFSY